MRMVSCMYNPLSTTPHQSYMHRDDFKSAVSREEVTRFAKDIYLYKLCETMQGKACVQHDLHAAASLSRQFHAQFFS